MVLFGLMAMCEYVSCQLKYLQENTHSMQYVVVKVIRYLKTGFQGLLKIVSKNDVT